MGSLGRRIEALEASLACSEAEPAGGVSPERELLAREFMRRSLEALASIRRAPIDPEPHRYSARKLRGQSPVTVVAHVAALAHLEHEDEDEARRILAELVEERGLDPAPHEKLIGMFARFAERAREGLDTRTAGEEDE